MKSHQEDQQHLHNRRPPSHRAAQLHAQSPVIAPQPAVVVATLPPLDPTAVAPPSAQPSPTSIKASSTAVSPSSAASSSASAAPAGVGAPSGVPSSVPSSPHRVGGGTPQTPLSAAIPSTHDEPPGPTPIPPTRHRHSRHQSSVPSSVASLSSRPPLPVRSNSITELPMDRSRLHGDAGESTHAAAAPTASPSLSSNSGDGTVPSRAQSPASRSIKGLAWRGMSSLTAIILPPSSGASSEVLR